ncbi:diguanylate cyclase (GGDEF) domain-containing protein [Nakamurella panacisegetis]|uniref:Diguanylate cyclase (GGDEF) domain-containing protein n=1 Tax=Nakamurella panacisegetis TaxID=1090615 RepID=A0A1H0LX03_9ACTN|nr:sensor domain-containing diguanylate cyclase [Nakamurella panacisegetis]SDO72634.1 diguanylate cyclase (GGDEF) domain-containing protein [Nakamurella panacisegetis]
MIPAPGIPPQRGGLTWTGPRATAVPDLDEPTPAQLAAIRATLAAIPMAAVAHTLSYRLIDANADCAELLSLNPTQIQGRAVRDFIPESDLQHAMDTARAVIATDGAAPRPSNSLRRLISGDGQELTCWMHVGLATIAGFTCFVACIDLINPVLSDAHRWRHRAEHDELTGLRRRGTMLDQVGRWLKSESAVILAFLDIDDFKSINDTYGHAAGDHVLTNVARRLEEHAPPGCAVGRLSGDEFVMALPVRHSHSVEALANLLTTVGARCGDKPIAWNDDLLVISISVGVTVSRPGEASSSLLSRADDAMYEQKSRQKAHVGRSVR